MVTQILTRTNTTRTWDKHYYEYIKPTVVINDRFNTLQVLPGFGNSIRIFTCYSPPVLSFHFYVSAFERNVWISVICSSLILAAFLNWHNHYNISSKLNFSSLLFYFSLFTEESFSVPSKIENNHIYKLVACLWLLTTIILTNIYVSNVIAGLNAPLKGNKLQDFHSLLQNTSKHISKRQWAEIVDFYNDRLFRDISKNHSLFADETDFQNELKRIHEISKLHSGFTFLSEPFRLYYPDNIFSSISNPYIYTAVFEIHYQAVNCRPFRREQLSSYC